MYWGPPIKELLPCNNCVIHIADFNGRNVEDNSLRDTDIDSVAERVALEMKRLIANPREMEQMLAWRTGEYNPTDFPRFKKYVNEAIDGVPCRILHALRGNNDKCKPECDSTCRIKNVGKGVKWVFNTTIGKATLQT